MLRSGVALVTGGTSGLGYAFADALLRWGTQCVVLVDIASSQSALKACAQLKDEYGADKVVHVRGDVSDPSQLRNVFMVASGKGNLRIVCNNAGICDESETWRRQVDINLSAVIEGTYLGIESMREHGQGGCIVNTASLGGIIPQRFCPVYSASKAGVIAFTRSLDELAASDGIRVNAIAPEYTETPFLQSAGMQSNAAQQADDLHTDIRKKLLQMVARTGKPISAQQVSDALIDILEDTSKAGSVVTCTSKGNEAMRFRIGPVGEPLLDLRPTLVTEH